MKLTETNFQLVVRYGGIALAVSCVAAIYLVMRYVEVYRDATRSVAQAQQLVLRQQALQGVLQDFAERAKTDLKVLEILQRNQLVAVTASNQPSKTEGVKP
jgi:hypothetical protein